MRASSIVPCKRLTGKERGYATKELVVSKIKNSKGWRADAERGRCPLRWLKLTSRTVMLLGDISSSGKTPESELYDKLRCDKLVRSPSDGEICPLRPLEARETSMTTPSPLQVIPSHTQQSVPFPHDLEMPPSCESPARNRRRELFSCSRHAMVDVAMASSSSKASLLLHGEWGAFFMTNLDEFCENDLSFFLEGRNGKFVAPGANTQIKYYQSLDHHKLALNKLNFLLELNLEGPMPKGGQTSTFSSSSFHGNPKLCGSMFGAGDHTTPTNISEKECNSKVIISAIASCVFFGIGMLYDQLVLSTYFR
uniref:Uncharacterized protein n=1 Tax=Leersia perrieri TaxID=77586 RepID=A0A0D9VCD3_9ORYZ